MFVQKFVTGKIFSKPQRRIEIWRTWPKRNKTSIKTVVDIHPEYPPKFSRKLF